MKLSEHFTLEEFLESSTAKAKRIDNTPDYESAARLSLLVCNVLEPARQLYGKPISISSGYRCPELNKAVGGVATSQHQFGEAADLQAADLDALFDVLKGMDVDQLLYEQNSKGVRWIHVSYRATGNRNFVNPHYKVK